MVTVSFKIKYAFKPSGRYPKLDKAVEQLLENIYMLEAEHQDKDNYERIKETLEGFKTEDELVQFLITPPNVYFEPRQEPTRKVLQSVIKKRGIINTEHVRFPHQFQDENGVGALSSKKLTMYPLYVRANQQISQKEGKSAKEDSSRDITGMVAGKGARSGAFTDAEITVSIAQHADNVMRELLGPGSHDAVAKRAMKQSIIQTGQVSLKDLPDSPENKKSNVYLREILRAYGIDTDLTGDVIR